MDENLRKQLSQDTTGLATYEYIANNIDTIDELLPELVDIIVQVDTNGQFVVSARHQPRALCLKHRCSREGSNR